MQMEELNFWSVLCLRCNPSKLLIMFKVFNRSSDMKEDLFFIRQFTDRFQSLRAYAWHRHIG